MAIIKIIKIILRAKITIQLYNYIEIKVRKKSFMIDYNDFNNNLNLSFMPKLASFFSFIKALTISATQRY